MREACVKWVFVCECVYASTWGDRAARSVCLLVRETLYFISSMSLVTVAAAMAMGDAVRLEKAQLGMAAALSQIECVHRGKCTRM